MTSGLSSQPPNPWEFKEAHDLLAAFERPSPRRTNGRPGSPPSPSPLDEAHLFDPRSSEPKGLGYFNRLFDFLEIPHEDPSSKIHESTETSSFSASDKSTPPSSLPEDGTNFEGFVGKGKEVRWTDEVEGNNIAEYRSRSIRSTSFNLDPALESTLEDSDIEYSTPSRNTRSRRKSRSPHVELAHRSECESEVEYQHTTRRYSKHRVRVRAESDEENTPLQIPATNTTLIPSSVTPVRRPKPTHVLWVPPPIPKIPFDPTVIQPIDTLTRKEKYVKLVQKLQKTFGSESEALIRMKPDQAAREYGGNNSPEGIHVFVDCSNIVIGFLDELKRRRGMNVRSPAKGGVISWHSLALVMERGRLVARRILVGSHGSPLDNQQPKRPDYLAEAEKCGYEVNVLDRVIKTKDLTPHKKRRGNGNGYATASGYSSGSDGTYMSRKAVTEQGVDEILHMKLLETLIDTEIPSTIVLASGDAAEAEYSGGFMKNVERALKNGWKVELVAWSATLSKDYQSKAFLGRWKGRFSIILLDDFSEELLAMYTRGFKAPKGVEELSA
jgi:hypothetical protein